MLPDGWSGGSICFIEISDILYLAIQSEKSKITIGMWRRKESVWFVYFGYITVLCEVSHFYAGYIYGGDLDIIVKDQKVGGFSGFDAAVGLINTEESGRI